MPKVTYVQADGHTETFEVAGGQSVMQGALQNGVNGIIAECGGACACATCQVYVDDAWTRAVGQPGPLEISMIADMDAERPHLRLSCQLQMSEGLDGLVVHIPGSQR